MIKVSDYWSRGGESLMPVGLLQLSRSGFAFLSYWAKIQNNATPYSKQTTNSFLVSFSVINSFNPTPSVFVHFVQKAYNLVLREFSRE